jgi:exodeoxyribonuclease VII small subunit
MEKISELSFEAAYTRMAEVIEQLESGSLTLEESVELYESGRRLAAHCQQLLDEAELRIRRITSDGTLIDQNVG